MNHSVCKRKTLHEASNAEVRRQQMHQNLKPLTRYLIAAQSKKLKRSIKAS